MQVYINYGDVAASEHYLFLTTGGVGADFDLHTTMVARVQVYINYGDVAASEHYLFLTTGDVGADSELHTLTVDGE
ncbi:MAG: hypothetical protein V8T53_08655 [Eubacteriales bacterium]